MTSQTPGTDPRREPGYRGTLATRDDRLARPWILAVLGIFALVLVLSVAGIPSRFFPEPTPLPLSSPIPSIPEPSASGSASASPSASSSASASESSSASPSASVEPSASASPSASPSGAP